MSDHTTLPAEDVRFRHRLRLAWHALRGRPIAAWFTGTVRMHWTDEEWEKQRGPIEIFGLDFLECRPPAGVLVNFEDGVFVQPETGYLSHKDGHTREVRPEK